MIIDNEDFEIKKSNYYWAGRLMFLPKEKAWQIADEVAEVIDYAQNKALTAPVDVEQREQLNTFVDWWRGLSQEELAWYEGRYVEVFLSREQTKTT
jgi:nitrate reductase assembly molybdenum cofactor insertion protein NarJ